ncbi:MAG: sigma-70 family RNA polymerase sigma factor [Myxococcales bacterium]|nr:sigma-70 family RNA polymerase sigma factor [Myxococcales bacterium]
MDAAAADLPPISHLYRQHRHRALAIARRILGDCDEAEDVVQDVFSKLCLERVRFDGKAAYSTWLYRIMVNSSINSLRSRRRRARLESRPGRPLGPEESFAGREIQRLLSEALSELTEQHRTMLWLRELRGLSYPEIAQLLGVPEGTVKSALNRGRARLLEVLERKGRLASELGLVLDEGR